MKKPGIVVTVLAVVVVSYFVMAYAVAQTSDAAKPAAVAGPSCGSCPSAAAAAPAGCPMAAHKAAKAPGLVKVLPEGQVSLSLGHGSSRGAKVLKLTIEGPAGQPDSKSTVTAYYMSSAGNHALKLTPVGAGVYTAPVKVAPNAELAVRVTSSDTSNVVYFGLPKWAGMRANCACPGSQPGADCKCPRCDCKTTGKCACPANKAAAGSSCGAKPAAAAKGCGAKAQTAAASCGAKTQTAVAKGCGGH